VAAAAVARGWSDSPVKVAMPGGSLVVSTDGRTATLVGPVDHICDGTTAI
jgi:diaminopimelate epimerase